VDSAGMAGSGRFSAITAAAVVAVALGACGLRPRALETSVPRDEIVITQADISRMGAKTAWEAVKRRVPGLTYEENAAEEPTRITRHGQSTILLNDTPLLFVDGVRVSDIRALGDIPASEIEVIRVRTGLNSSAEFGTNSEGGVILVETHLGN
jgi:outer membrane cobalamin receptor